ncbi:MAG: DUF3786 domain-containing protein [Dehalococcoidales bacterium]|nr:DUF3786 domain-containing protein [Dehalococcoidales bacterium]
MENRHFTSPEQKNYERAYSLAYKLAREQLVRIDDIEQQCRKSNSQYQVIDAKKVITIRYLNQSYLITLPGVEISPLDSPGEVPARDRLLILHYFLTAKGTPLTGKLIPFRELPEGTVYSPTFAKRTIQPLLTNFGKEPERLLEICQKLGGIKTDYGDMAVTIDAFSRVPITIVLWRGDDEFPPEGNILFDATIPDYLPTEDITVLCEILTWKLIKSLS